jgi:hypothetical protein
MAKKTTTQVTRSFLAKPRKKDLEFTQRKITLLIRTPGTTRNLIEVKEDNYPIKTTSISNTSSLPANG